MIEIKRNQGLAQIITVIFIFLIFFVLYNSVSVKAELFGLVRDSKLEQVIRDTINKQEGELTAADLASITKINASWKGITDLSGLEYAVNLEELDLSGNSITSISNISSLTKLKMLYMRNNSISDISVLLGLRGLILLDLRQNQIENILPLTNLSNLRMLYLAQNKISDISALRNLTNITTLEINDNLINNIMSMDRLVNLNWLDIGDNQIKDISILRNLNKINNLYLGKNQIGSISVLKYLTNLKDLDLGVNPLGSFQDDPANKPLEIIKYLESKSVNINYELILINPIDEFVTNINKVTISGRSKLGSNLYVNNELVTTDLKGYFSKDILLNEGKNEIKVCNKSSDGTITAQLIRNVYYDKYSLSLSVFSPQDNLYTSSDWIYVEGKADKGSIISVMVNGSMSSQSVTTDNEGNFIKKVNISLGENNLIIIASKAGNTYSREYRKVIYDNVPPNLSASVEKTLTNQNTVKVSGIAELGSRIKINNIEAVNVDGKFEKSVNLLPGDNTLTVTATDIAGNIKKEILKVYYDNSYPSLTIIDPLRYNIVTGKSTFKITGSAEIGCIVKINNSLVVTNNMGIFSKIIGLENGDNIITVTVTDPAGNITTEQRKVNSTAPSIFSPVNNYRTRNDSVTVTGRASLGTNIKINNNEVNYDNLGNFSTNISLVTGENIIEVVSEEEKITRKVIKDNISDLTLKNPVDNLRTNKNKVTINGIGEKGGYVNVNINNINIGNVATDSKGIFTTSATIQPGENKLLITAFDDLGNSTKVQRNVFYDNIPPSLILFGPEDNLKTNRKVTVEGIAEINSIVRVNGLEVSVNIDGKFSKNLTLVNGNNNITVTATDDVGNISTQTRRVNFDNIPPSVTIVSPRENFATRNNSVIIYGSTEIGSTLTLNNEIVTLDSIGNFSIEVPLVNGVNTVNLLAKDSLGNEKLIKRHIIVDTIAPKASVSIPYFTTSISKNNQFLVSWSAKDEAATSGISSYDIQYLSNVNNIWKDWKIGTTLTKSLFSGKPGYTYYFRIRARDRANNLGDWSKIYKTIMPYDDYKLICSKQGFYKIYVNKKSNYFQGTLTYSKKNKEKITYKFRGSEVGLITSKAKDRSKAKIYIDGKYICTVDAYSKVNQYRSTIFKKSWRENGIHTITIENLSVKGRSRFDIDGLAIGRLVELPKG